ncbi:uncharacterized protein LOC110816145 [Carica papaya]|uniref:uncharacterized protein LOC110816145 n=1 Tax=Carica papaya TaxID=3649 RepID=UPI000B8C9C33|nr:uncharacterized protein LOC110816145 [Carica papaya]
MYIIIHTGLLSVTKQIHGFKFSPSINLLTNHFLKLTLIFTLLLLHSKHTKKKKNTQMGISENYPLLLRNLITSIFIFAENSLSTLAQKYKLLNLLRSLLVASSLFFLRLLSSLFSPNPNLNPLHDYHKSPGYKRDHYMLPDTAAASAAASAAADSGIGRALSQLLSIINDLPVSSRKYEVVRSLAENLMDENQREGVPALREVNRAALTAAFARTISQLETSMAEMRRESGENPALGDVGPVLHGLNRVLRTVRSAGIGVLARIGNGKRVDVDRSGGWSEKLAAELLWLAQKMGACGFGEEAVERWASASNLAWLALSAEPRLQCSMVKVAALLFKQAKNTREEKAEEDEEERQTKMKLLMAWLPLLCRGSNGTDVPVLSVNERGELEKILEDTIETLQQQEQQERVFSLWLHHFTHCSSSDWPNLHASYSRWCTSSRKLFLLDHNDPKI